MGKSTLATDDEIEALAKRLDVHRMLIDGQEVNPGAAHRALAAEVARLRTQNAELVETLASIANFAPGNGDVCEIIAKRARAALSRATKESGNG